MLKHRILTALVLVPLLLVVIFIAPEWVFQAVVAVVIVGAAYEWGTLMACTTRRDRLIFTAVVALAVALTWWGLDQWAWLLPGLIVTALAWWLFVSAWLIWRPARAPTRAVCTLKGLCGLLTLVPAFAAILALHAWPDAGPWRLLFLLALVWLADVGAYFAGRQFGRHKLAPNVSPGKTWEGVAGAFAMTLVVIAAGHFYGMGFGPVWYFTLVCVLTVALSILGDLAESMFKRQQGVKDSGSLLPGHGGLMDRIDSLTSAAPLFVGGMLVVM